ncbi:organic cation transporter protein-like [Lineus longissimus]|uniref:organic cation transporter protein-like n=1 Tax=Lineus longissimus TaxID=88925 RepID=UPI002B4E54FA
MKFDVDKALTRLGNFNRWRLLMYTCVALSFNVSGTWHMMVVVFTGGEPDHHCNLPPNVTKEDAIPKEIVHGKSVYSHCKQYINLSSETNETENCPHGWWYDPDIGKTTVTEWDLVCDRNFYVETSQSVFVAGVLVGALLFTTMADRFGRKPVHFACQWAMIVIGTLCAVVPDFTSFAALKFFNGALREGTGLTGIVLTCELWQASMRSVTGVGMQLFWSLAWFSLALLAYLIRDWRQLQLVISLVSLFTIPLFWVIPESIIWLAANGKGHEAADLLRKATTWDGKPHALDDIIGDGTERLMSIAGDGDVSNHVTNQKKQQVFKRLRDLLKGDDKKEDDGPKYTLLDIFRSRKMLLYSSIMCSLWFVNTLVYHGLTLLSSKLAGNIYLNFFFSGLVEVPAYIVCILVLQTLGRRWPLCFHHVLTGVALLIASFLPEETESGTDIKWLITVFALIGKYGITFSFAEVVLYCQEIYPTNLRNAGIGLSSLFGRVANILAPFSTYVIKFFPGFPGILFGVMSIVIGFVSLLLPETLGRPLPLSIEDIENWDRIPRKRSEERGVVKVDTDSRQDEEL